MGTPRAAGACSTAGPALRDAAGPALRDAAGSAAVDAPDRHPPNVGGQSTSSQNALRSGDMSLSSTAWAKVRVARTGAPLALA